jgi:hypothetical protein
VRAEWDAAIVEATKQAHITEQNNALIGVNFGGRYNESTKTIDSDFDSALNLLRGSAGGSLPTKSNPTSGVNAKAICAGFLDTDKEIIISLMRAAQKQTNQLILLQSWQKEIR